jgi:hypothetical protein
MMPSQKSGIEIPIRPIARAAAAQQPEGDADQRRAERGQQRELERDG